MTPGVHLHFAGECREALECYARLLDGTITFFLTYSDSPMADQVPAARRSDVVHATLRVGDLEIAGSDVAPEDRRTAGGFHIMLPVPSPAEAERIFDALSDGGEVTMPLQETFWSPAYGALVDRFGVPWEISTQTAT